VGYRFIIPGRYTAGYVENTVLDKHNEMLRTCGRGNGLVGYEIIVPTTVCEEIYELVYYKFGIEIRNGPDVYSFIWINKTNHYSTTQCENIEQDSERFWKMVMRFVGNKE